LHRRGPVTNPEDALAILHHHKGGIAVLADVVKSANVWVIQTRNGASLCLETSAIFGLSRQGGGNGFDRNGTFQSRIERTIDFAHTARTDHLLNFVRTQFRALLKRHFARDYTGTAGRYLHSEGICARARFQLSSERRIWRISRTFVFQICGRSGKLARI
jgi:hypothetical protein